VACRTWILLGYATPFRKRGVQRHSARQESSSPASAPAGPVQL